MAGRESLPGDVIISVSLSLAGKEKGTLTQNYSENKRNAFSL
jgi:hypothetical protein